MIKTMKNLPPVTWLVVVALLSCHQFARPITAADKQFESLYRLIKNRRSGINNPPSGDLWDELDAEKKDFSPVYVGDQDGKMKDDEIVSLPGQPPVSFDQYAGYVTVDPKAGRALFYYFVESPENPSTKPLLLWLNGGPGCSSLGYGAMEELGPFRVNSDGKTLFKNDYAWNNVANVLFLESPAGVGFSYSNTSSDYINVGDKRTAEDAYTFLVNWLQRFPQYKTRDFYIAGESYAGHYVPQLAYTVVSNNRKTNQTVINLKGFAIGNAWIDDNTSLRGMYDFYWTHALSSDETNAGIKKYCDYVTGNFSETCERYQGQADREVGAIDIYNIYAPICGSSSSNAKPQNPSSVKDFDPCSDDYVYSYLNLKEVQKALHSKNTRWSACRGIGWTDMPTTILPIIKQLIEHGLRIWVYSGDIDGRVPITSSRYSINTFKLPVETAWRPWYSKNEVGGYVAGYKGLVLATVRGAGHTVPSYQPERALTLVSSFLQGNLPPAS